MADERGSRTLTHTDITECFLNGWQSQLFSGREESAIQGDVSSRCQPLPPEALVSPRYRGAFEVGEMPPRRVNIGTLDMEDLPGGASMRFRAPSFPFRRSREFGVSVDIDPSFWKPLASRQGWQFFLSASSPDWNRAASVLGLWSSLPATWLAQKPDGTVLPPPWRELWTFGTDHIWICRIAFIGESSTETFMTDCLEWSPGAEAHTRWQKNITDTTSHSGSSCV